MKEFAVVVVVVSSLVAACTARIDVRGAEDAPALGAAGIKPIGPVEAPARVEHRGWAAARGARDDDGDSRVHVVREGDTLHRIARDHGVTLAMLYSANGLLNDRLTPGQHVLIPHRRRRSDGPASVAAPLAENVEERPSPR